MIGIKLSKKGDELIKLYEEMAVKGVNRTDGTRKENVYNDFQLRKFRNLCQDKIANEKIKTNKNQAIFHFLLSNFHSTYFNSKSI